MMSATPLTKETIGNGFPIGRIAQAFDLDLSDTYAHAHLMASHRGILPKEVPPQIQEAGVRGGRAIVKLGGDAFTNCMQMLEAAINQRVVGY